METTAALTMATVLSTITEVFTSAVGWVGTVAETVAGNPLLLIGVVIGFIGTGIGLFSLGAEAREHSARPAPYPFVSTLTKKEVSLYDFYFHHSPDLRYGISPLLPLPSAPPRAQRLFWRSRLRQNHLCGLSDKMGPARKRDYPLLP